MTGHVINFVGSRGVDNRTAVDSIAFPNYIRVLYTNGTPTTYVIRG